MFRFFGLDTETVNGKPHTIQLCDGKRTDLYFVNSNKILETFRIWISKRIWRNKVNLVFVHNIAYDLVVLLFKHYKKFADNHFTVKHKGMRFVVDLRRGRYFCNLYMGKTKIVFIDTFYFFPHSLEFVAERLNLKYKKMKKPRYLGEKSLRDKAFVEYAKNDAWLTWDLGRYIIDLHKEYNVPFSISIAQMSQYIFQKNFLKEKIYLPPKRVCQYALLSYHGGKNAYYNKDPKYFKKVYELDIVSAYPYAMSILPNFYGASYCFVDKYIKGYCGVYFIEAEIRNTKYKLIATQDFKYISGRVKTFVTSFELEQALKDKLIKKIYRINGFILDQSVKKKRLVSPLNAFVSHFYKLKSETDKKDPKYLFYKILLNSLYGKFIQKNEDEPEEDFYIDKDTVFKVQSINYAGGMWNPFIATMITGFVRTQLYLLEKKFKAIHSSTDSIKTLVKPTGCKKDLGGYIVECFGDCLIFRSKLYIHYNKRKEVQKYALHGFQGKVSDLEKIWRTKKPTYIKKRIIPVRESLVRKLESPLQHEKRLLKLYVNL